MNPIRKIGRMISELLDSRGVSYDETLPELSAGSRSSASTTASSTATRSSSRAG